MIPTPNVEDKITVGNARLDGPMNSVPVIETHETNSCHEAKENYLVETFQNVNG